jgi:hypothetical protein
MNKSEVQALGHGLYKIYWTESSGGGSSLAAVGSTIKGDRWIACTNWVRGAEYAKVWDHVESVTLISEPVQEDVEMRSGKLLRQRP